MSRHEGVSCDSCLKSNFRGRRYKCLICYDYDLCASCYENGANSARHTTDHPMQCILTRSDFELYYGGETLGIDQPQAYTCPFCNRMGFSDASLLEHVTADHADTSLEVVCPVCAAMPGGEPNLVTDDFAGHLTLEHRTGPRDLISFLDEPTGIRHGGVRRAQHSGRGIGVRTRRNNMHFSGSGGLSALSPGSREAVVDPIAELLSQLSGARRNTGPAPAPSQLQQLQMQLQLERHQVSAARQQQLERVPRRGGLGSGGSSNQAGGTSSAPATSQNSAPSAPSTQGSTIVAQNAMPLGGTGANANSNQSSDSNQSSQFLLARFLGGMTCEEEASECGARAQFAQAAALGSLGRPPPPPAPARPPRPIPPAPPVQPPPVPTKQSAQASRKQRTTPPPATQVTEGRFYLMSGLSGSGSLRKPLEES